MASGENILQVYGYRQRDFLHPGGKYGIFFTAAGFLSGGILLSLAVLLWHKKYDSYSGIDGLSGKGEYWQRRNPASNRGR